MYKLVGAGLALLAAIAPGAASAQQLGGAAALPVSPIRVAAALLFCLAAVFAIVMLLRRRQTGSALPLLSSFLPKLNARSRIRIIEARRLSPFADLCIVRCDDCEYVVLCGQAGIELLKTTPLDDKP